MSDVFFSYARRDHEAARRIVEALRAAGLTVSDDQDMTPGADFARQLEAELESAQCVFILWSAAANESQWLQNALRFVIKAWSSDRLVVAALDETELPTGLRDIQRMGVDDIALIVARVRQVVSAARAVKPDSHASHETAAPATSQSAAGRSRSRGRLSAILVGLAVVALVGALAFLFTQRSEAPAPNTAAPNVLPAPPPEFHRPAPGGALEGGKATTPAPEPETSSALNEQSLPLMIALILGGALAGGGLVWLGLIWTRRRASIARPIATVPSDSTAAAPIAGRQVFISYSHEDGNAVEALVQKIEATGFPVWIDRELSPDFSVRPDGADHQWR